MFYWQPLFCACVFLVEILSRIYTLNPLNQPSMKRFLLFLFPLLFLLSFTAQAQLCQVPSGASFMQIGYSDIYLDWSGSATNYEVRYSKANPIVWKTEAVAGNQLHIDSVSPGNYVWQVRAMCTLGSSAWTGNLYYGINPYTCQEPFVTISDLSAYSKRFSWNANATSQGNNGRYELWISPKSPVNWTKITTTASSVQVDTLPDGEYMCKVLAVCSFEYEVWSSNVGYFTVGDCGIPKDLKLDGVTSTSASFSWSGATTSYFQYRYSKVNPISWTTSGLTTNTGKTLNALEFGNSYIFEVRQRCAYGDTSDWTGLNFSTKCYGDHNLRITHQYGDTVGIGWQGFGSYTYSLIGPANSNITGQVTDTLKWFYDLPQGDYRFILHYPCSTGDNTDTLYFTIGSGTCAAPDSLYTTDITTTSARFNYSFENYGGDYRYSADNGATWTVLNAGPNYSDRSGLTPSTNYLWQVRTRCNSGYSNWSDTVHFRTLDAGSSTCDAPDSLYVTELIGTSAKVNWSGNGPEYNYMYRELPNGDWSNYITPGEFGYLVGLTKNTSYEWMVRTICGPGDSSNWSDTARFTTKMYDCDSPDSLFTTDITANSARFNCAWRNYSHYEYRYSSDNGSTWTTYGAEINNHPDNSGLTPSTDYIWQVRVDCNGFTQWSDTVRFRTLGNPPCATPDSTWTSDVTTYNARLNWTGNAPQFQVVGWSPTGPSFNEVTTNNYLDLQGLPANTEYSWMVRSICNYPDVSDWSDTLQFTTLPIIAPCPTPDSLWVDRLSSHSAYLNWNGNAYQYEVAYRKVGDSIWNYQSFYYNESRAHSLTPLTDYEWIVRVICGAGDTSLWSDTSYFTTKDICPVPDSVWVDFMGDSVTLNWNNTAPEYIVSVRDITGGFYYDAVVATNTVTIGNVVPGRTYVWRLTAICAVGDTSGRDTSYYFTIPLLDTCPIPDSIYFTIIDNNSARVEWSNVGPEYEVRMTDHLGSYTLYVENINSRLYYNVLNSGETYQVQVRTICAPGDTSDWSSPAYFTTPGGTGIQTIGVRPSLDIYPNPTTGSFTISNSLQMERVELLDVSGKMVYQSSPVSEKTVIDLQLEIGTYIVRIIDSSGVKTSRIIRN